MFIGEYAYSIDEKKRLAIPAKFRLALGKKAVLTRGIDNCLVLYPLSEWEKLSKKLENLEASFPIQTKGIEESISNKINGLSDLINRNSENYTYLNENLKNMISENNLKTQENSENTHQTLTNMSAEIGILTNKVEAYDLGVKQT